MLGSVDLKQSLERVDLLPAMPVIAQKMLALPLDTDEGESQLLRLVSQDPQVSAKIIGLSNTALFGAPSSVTSVKDAAMHLGLTLVKNVAIGMATMSTLTKLPEGKIKSVDLWAHSMAISMVMRIIARHMPPRLRPRDDQIFLAGLLHDIGYNVLNYLDTNASNKLYEKLSAGSDMPQLEMEYELLGTNHCEIGARIGSHWGLPEEIIDVIRYHHTPEDANAEIGQPLINLVHVAEKILLEFRVVEHDAHEITEQEWGNLHVDGNKLDTIAGEIEMVAEQVKRLVHAL